jgi:predicted O-methyltransferase YrrM
MMNEQERLEIARLWQRKLDQDAKGLPQFDRHRNLEPDSAEFIHSLVCGTHARNLLEIGGSSGLSTIALASAARETNGKLTSIEIEPQRQQEARATIEKLGLSSFVNFVLGDAADVLPTLPPMDFILIDCEKDDYIRFFNMLKLEREAIIVADNILSHSLSDYVSHVRSLQLESITLPVGKGLELTRVMQSKTGTQ